MGFMTTEPWDMPLLNWEPEGSFEAPITPPLLGPTGGTLVCIPPVNKDWIKIILGCLDQLRIPATWNAVDRADLLQALNWMQELKDTVASAGPCCDVAMRLNNCVLQFSTDSGTTWTDVTGWSANFCSCVAPCITPTVPTFPPGQTVNQHACNISGYIAQRIIEITMQKVVAYVGTTGQELVWANAIMAELGFVFPVTAFAFNAFVNWYNSVVSQLLSQVTFVSTDVVFWSDVTCAIYAAIRTLGYVNASNYATAEANIAAISYTYPWAVAAVAAFWNDVGLQNVQAMQNAGALDDIDCSGCPSPWCFYFDFTASNGGWSIFSGVPFGSYISGVGWQTGPAGSGFNELVIIFDMGVAVDITRVDFFIQSNQGSTGAHTTDIQVRPSYFGAGTVQAFSYPVANPTPVWTDVPITANGRFLLADISCSSASSGFSTIVGLQVHGTGVNPFGPDNCIH